MSEKEVEYRIPEYPNKEKGFIFDEEKFGEFSSEIFNKPFIAILCAIYLNFIYIFLESKYEFYYFFINHVYSYFDHKNNVQ